MKKEFTETERAAVAVLRKAKQACFDRRKWRQAISTAWMTGNYSRDGLDIADLPSELQRIRNTLGPTWLSKVSLSQPRTKNI